MTVHRYHPDPRNGDDPEAILHDNCERCAEHAEHPFASLDTNNQARLIQRAIDVNASWSLEHPERYRSQNEAIAGNKLYNAFVAIRRLRQYEPDLFTEE